MPASGESSPRASCPCWRRVWFGGSLLLVGLLVFLGLRFTRTRVTSRPPETLLVGNWKCSELPPGFEAEAGSVFASRLLIRADYTLDALNFPQRDPYRYVNFQGATWTLTDPSMTPGNVWSIELYGNFLECWKKGDELILRYTISGADEYWATYRKEGH